MKYRSSCRTISVLVLLSTGNILFSQNKKANDTLTSAATGVNISAKDSSSSRPVFLDSLKSKTSKNRLMKKLYHFVVVHPNPANGTGFTGKSEEGFVTYKGLKIRRIEIRRLDVFGTNINNPVDAKSQGLNNILNKSHVSTSEKIIRKNLLFSEGDTISALTLSENERILRQLPYIDDARIIVLPFSDGEADITILTKDVYSLGAELSYKGLKKGVASVFEKNLFGTGHELGIDVPYDSSLPGSPGFGVNYKVNNIAKSFINLSGYYLNGLGKETYGFSLSRKLVTAETKYAGGISIVQMYTTEDLDTLPVPQPLKYNLQDYWLQRSFLINRERVSRIILGARYTNNNVFDRPFILPDSHYNLQNYKVYLASAAFSVQKFYKTKLIYSYGRTEDIPYGGLIRLTGGREYNEFNEYRQRTYLASEIAIGNSLKTIGYFYASAGIAAFVNGSQARQGLMTASLNYFSNLLPFGEGEIRNFLYFNYTRGFDRNIDEHLLYNTENGFSGFRNDSIRGNQRLTVCVESVLFSPANLYGFKFAFFGFADLAFLSGNISPAGRRSTLTGIGIGIRVRNDNLVFNTLQIRIGFFPNPPEYSSINHITVSGEQLLRPPGFDSGPPAVIPYK